MFNKLSTSANRTGAWLTYNVLGLCEEGDIEEQMFNKPQILIELQMSNLKILPLFCKTLVSGTAYCCRLVPVAANNFPPTLLSLTGKYS